METSCDDNSVEIPLSEKSDLKYGCKLTVPAHTADVRVVKIFPGGIVSGSRDKLVKLWTPTANGCYEETRVFVGPTKYISSLLVLPSSDQFPKGLILAGSNDCAIYGFAIDSTEPVLKLLGHSDTVSSLSAGMFGTIVSGSWDKTARVWSGQQCSEVLNGHQQAIWATEVLPEQNLILTASADCTIRLWRSGNCEKVFAGHDDCVRGLAVISERKFLSCSNDCTVRLWEIGGDCLNVYHCHSDYIYSITLLENGLDFATCSEDHKVKIWRNGECVQTLLFGKNTLWTISCATNGDLAVGSSDGTLYILGKVPHDYSPVVSENSVTDVPNELLIPANGEHSNGVSEAELASGASVSGQMFDKKGEYDGQSCFVYDEESCFMTLYKWNESSQSWLKENAIKEGLIEDLAKKNNKMSGAKKRKSYSFDVDVEGVMYKLLYTAGENPWEVAQTFVAKHNLSIEHVAQVADHIIQNTDDVPPKKEKFNIPKLIGYAGVNIDGLTAKLVEFSQLVPKEYQISLEQIEGLVLLAEIPDDVSVEQMASMDKLLMWNDEFLFPALDLLRLAVRCKGMQSKMSNPSFINHLLQTLSKTSNWMNVNLIMKIFCNMFLCEEGKAILEKFQGKVFDTVKEALIFSDTRAQKAALALFWNYAVAATDGMKMEINLFCSSVCKIMQVLVDSEAIYRCLMAIATFCNYDELACDYFNSLHITKHLNVFKMSTNAKVVDIANTLLLEFE